MPTGLISQFRAVLMQIFLHPFDFDTLGQLKLFNSPEAANRSEFIIIYSKPKLKVLLMTWMYLSKSGAGFGSHPKVGGINIGIILFDYYSGVVPFQYPVSDEHSLPEEDAEGI